jgi:outer membrane protein assembly factor BamB
MNTTEIIYIGAKAHVAAVHRQDGRLLWRTKLTGGLKLSGSSFVTLLIEEGRVYAYTYGALYCLDAASGEKLFACQVPGLGRGIAMLATLAQPSPPVPAAGHEFEASADDAAAVAAAGA